MTELRDLRHRLRWSQDAMAEFLGLGDRRRVHDVETGRRELPGSAHLPLQMLQRLEAAGTVGTPAALRRRLLASATVGAAPRHGAPVCLVRHQDGTSDLVFAGGLVYRKVATGQRWEPFAYFDRLGPLAELVKAAATVGATLIWKRRNSIADVLRPGGGR